MNHDPLYERLRATGWRRELTEAEAAEIRAWLNAHPEARQDWELEEELNLALRKLEDASVASNFTARVLKAVEREAAPGAPQRGFAWPVWWRSLGWLPKAAVAVLVLGLSGLSVERYQAATRHRLARDVAALGGVKPLPSPEVLQDFDAIRRLGRSPAPDVVLLGLMK